MKNTLLKTYTWLMVIVTTINLLLGITVEYIYTNEVLDDVLFLLEIKFKLTNVSIVFPDFEI